MLYTDADRSCLPLWRSLHVIIRRKVLKEVALLLHDAVELVEVDLAITILVGLVDHVLELLIVDSLSELLSLDLESEGTHGALELAAVDGARVVGIEKSEDL